MANIYKVFPALLFFISLTISGFCQSTAESNESTSFKQDDQKATTISGYGEFRIRYDLRYKTGDANLTRTVLFVGHRFSQKVSLVSELELEDGRIEGGEAGGELNMEQLYLKFNLNKNQYINAGLFIPRIGIINENHLPNTYSGNERPYTETLVIPSTWREIGIGWYGSSDHFQGLTWSLSVMNGLNASAFENETGIRGGRQGGSMATATNMAVTGSLLYNSGNIRTGISGYFGGSTGISQREADSLLLDNGPFGTPVILGEANFTYTTPVVSFKILATAVSIPDAQKLNRAYANNTAELIYGGYAEASIDLLKCIKPQSAKKLDCFMRAELINLNAKIPDNGITNEVNEKSIFIGGLQYFPTEGVVIKADYTLRNTGAPNPSLVINPYPNSLPYYKSNGFFSVGAGYSF